jgi:hypothetical protein
MEICLTDAEWPILFNTNVFKIIKAMPNPYKKSVYLHLPKQNT